MQVFTCANIFLHRRPSNGRSRRFHLPFISRSSFLEYTSTLFNAFGNLS